MGNEFDGSWEDFCVACYPKIVNYARTLVNGDLSAAEDLAQMTVIRVLKYAPNPESIKNRLGYVKTITKRLWIDSRRPAELSIEDLLESEPNNPAFVKTPDIIAILELEADFVRRVGPLTAQHRTMLIMRLRGYTWHQIAETLNEPVTTTKFRWFALLKRVHERIRDKGDE